MSQIDFFTSTGYEYGEVWVCGEFDDDGEFIVSDVYPRNGPSFNLRPYLSLEQVEGFKGPALKALADRAELLAGEPA